MSLAAFDSEPGCRSRPELPGERGADTDDYDHGHDPKQDHAAAATVGDVGETGKATGHRNFPFLRAHPSPGRFEGAF
jgi:hypothetical protein